MKEMDDNHENVAHASKQKNILIVVQNLVPEN